MWLFCLGCVTRLSFIFALNVPDEDFSRLKLVFPRLMLELPTLKLILPRIKLEIPTLKLVLPRIKLEVPILKLVLPRLNWNYQYEGRSENK
jgi:hypothetical protein